MTVNLCPGCGAQRRVMTVATRIVVAVCRGAVGHCEVVEVRPGPLDWADDDRWWRQRGLEPPADEVAGARP